MANEVTIHVKAKDDASKTLGSVGSNAKKMGVAAGVAALAVGTVLVRALSRASAASREAEKVHRQTDAVLKSTGNAAKISAAGVAKLADSISKKTGIDDEAIQSGENLLLTFTNIRNETGKGNDVFNQATKTITDMSVALGQDMKSSAIQVGKALNDPIKGMTALRRVGVSFTEDQEKQVKALVKSGKTLEAQKLILAELRKEFGGSAEAAATWADKAKVAFGNLEEDLGGLVNRGLEPIARWFVKTGAPAISDFFDKIGKNKDLKRALGDLRTTLKQLGATDLSGFFDSLNEGLPEAVDSINKATRAFGKLHGGIKGTEDAMDKGLGLEKVLKFRATVIRMLANVAAAWAKSPLAPAGAKKAAAALDSMADAAEKDLNQVRQEFIKTANKVNRTKVESKVKADIHDLQAKVRTAQQRLRETHNKKTQAKIRAEIGQLQTQISRARGLLASLNGKTATVSIVTRRSTVYGGGSGGGHDPGYARGGNVGAADGGNRSGQIMVGERGPEMVQLPSGSHVFPNGNTASMTGRRGGGGINIYVNAPNYVGAPTDLLRALVDAKRRGQLDVILR